jgi:hypothetical protein
MKITIYRVLVLGTTPHAQWFTSEFSAQRFKRNAQANPQGNRQRPAPLREVQVEPVEVELSARGFKALLNKVATVPVL